MIFTRYTLERSVFFPGTFAVNLNSLQTNDFCYKPINDSVEFIFKKKVILKNKM